MEKIEAVSKAATWKSSMVVVIPSSKKEAEKLEKKDSSIYKVYTDGSGIDGRIGVSAVLYRQGIEIDSLRPYLGKADHHTLFEGEGIGSILVLTSHGHGRQSAGNPTLTSTLSHWIWDVWHS
jgi:hypothetical protein